MEHDSIEVTEDSYKILMIIIGLLFGIGGPIFFRIGLNTSGKMYTYGTFIGVVGTPLGIGIVIYAIFFYKQLTYIFSDQGITVHIAKSKELVNEISKDSLTNISIVTDVSVDAKNGKRENTSITVNIFEGIKKTSLSLPGKIDEQIAIARQLIDYVRQHYSIDPEMSEKITVTNQKRKSRIRY